MTQRIAKPNKAFIITKTPRSVYLTVWHSPMSAATVTLANPKGHKTVGKVIYDFRKSCGFPSYSVNGVSYTE